MRTASVLSAAACAAALFFAGPASAGTPALETLRAAGAADAAAPEPGPSRDAWLDEVKSVYLSFQGLERADYAELPEAAKKQMQEDAAVYPSRAFKLTLDGRTAYLIENDNNDALYVNIFGADGAHLAFGGFDENYDFWWLPPGPAGKADRGAQELTFPEYCRINDKDLNALAEAVMTRESPRDPVSGNLFIELAARAQSGKDISAKVVNVRHSHPGDQFHIEVYAGGKLLFKSGRQDNPIFIGFQVDDVPYSLTCFEDIR